MGQLGIDPLARKFNSKPQYSLKINTGCGLKPQNNGAMCTNAVNTVSHWVQGRTMFLHWTNNKMNSFQMNIEG